MGKERIDKLLSLHLNITRNEARQLVKTGQAEVDGIVCRDFGQKVDGSQQTIAVQGKELQYSRFVYIMQNKPKGVISASKGNNYKTVVDILPEEMKRKNLFPAGRLDKDTTGFVLITDDGELAHRILSPKKHVEKTYQATLDKSVTHSVIKGFEKGIILKDETEFQSAKLKTLDETGINVEIVIKEGKYHQIKRMFLSFGITVLELNRSKIGSLNLDPALKPGEARFLTTEELVLLEK